MKIKHLITGLFCLGFSLQINAQIDENQWGAWYMYFFDGQAKNSNWGIQGDVQYRNWNTAGDLEQLLIRAGLTYSPEDWAAKFTLGYGNIQTGEFGESDATNSESRMYQEMLMPQHLGWRVFLKHRFRYEQRWVEGMDFRTRYRYALFVTVPLNTPTLEVNSIYLALYDELFINGQREVGNNKTVEIFDRNRAYAALGYKISPQIKVQAGVMRQTTNSWAKNQVQLSLHHSF